MVADHILSTINCIVGSYCVAEQCVSAGGGVKAAGCVAREGIKADGQVVDAGCETEKRGIALSGVAVWIASVRRWWRYSACAAGESANHANRNAINEQ